MQSQIPSREINMSECYRWIMMEHDESWTQMAKFEQYLQVISCVIRNGEHAQARYKGYNRNAPLWVPMASIFWTGSKAMEDGW